MDEKAQGDKIELGRLPVRDELSVLRNIDRLKRVLVLAGADKFEVTLTSSLVSEVLNRFTSPANPAELSFSLARTACSLEVRIRFRQGSVIGLRPGAFWTEERTDDSLSLVRRIDVSEGDLAGFEDQAIAVIEEKSEEEIKALILAKEAAEAAKLAQSQFIRRMSHELRTPLNVILGYTEILQEQFSADQVSDDLHSIYEAGKQLLSIVDNVLDFSRLEMGVYELHLEQFSCRDLVADIVAERRNLWGRHDNRFELEEPDVDVQLNTDRDKLRYTLDHLLANATEFTEHGLIRLSWRALDAGEGGEVEFVVGDSGIGMNASELDNLFHPFMQKDHSTTRKHGGIGMGLALCERYSQILGGELEVSSTPDVGTRFTLRVPRELTV